ncbi:hypothetical protein L1787_16135 [Acuticoccus sp. M5D2P5]|uniref:hypothetical protein n=1 Tax=Acuticoccus kalidii TaxID=2910977 RepID=UPI001F408143|nr:hypothetical protein [Acuticoccus kalidii]MCF3934934.1 hypothetical protein [Acuticoccus kalidii]
MKISTRAIPFQQTLMVSTVLSSCALFFPQMALAQNSYGCEPSGDTCIFDNGTTTDKPFLYTSNGSAGSGDTPGGNGGGGTFVYNSDIDVSLPGDGNPSNYLYGTWVNTVGGNGSSNGPSAGGQGGDLTITPPSSATYTINEYASTAYEMEAARFISTGGNGNDDNSNNKSNGGAGGAGGNVTYNGEASSNTILTSISGVTGPGTIAALRVSSIGGTGGRGNEGANFMPLGGNGGAGGTVQVDVGNIVTGSADNPLTAQSVYGVWGQSAGGRGPNAYNSSNGETQGGGGSSTGGAGGSVTLTANYSVTAFGQATDGAFRGVYAESTGGDGGYSYDVGVDSNFAPGGAGGVGGAVDVNVFGSARATQSGTIASTDQSGTIVAISTGGTGGVGQHGEPGGNGGAGGSVTVSMPASTFSSDGIAVLAAGTAVDGILAVSQGGTGGAGLSNANDSRGGNGGNAGDVSVTLDITADQSIKAEASSAGNDSGRGVVAQSIGQFGGDGGAGNVVFGSPGSAGGGGNGGTVDVTLTSGVITTDGTNRIGSKLDFAHGILA